MTDRQLHSAIGTERPAGPLSSDSVWQPLRYFNIYRLLLAGLFLVLVVWGNAPRPLGESNIALFRAAAVFYFLFGLTGAIAGRGTGIEIYPRAKKLRMKCAPRSDKMIRGRRRNPSGSYPMGIPPQRANPLSSAR